MRCQVNKNDVGSVRALLKQTASHITSPSVWVKNIINRYYNVPLNKATVHIHIKYSCSFKLTLGHATRIISSSSARSRWFSWTSSTSLMAFCWKPISLN